MTIEDSKEFSIKDLPLHVARELQKYVKTKLISNIPKPKPFLERPSFPSMEVNNRPKTPLLRADYIP